MREYSRKKSVRQGWQFVNREECALIVRRCNIKYVNSSMNEMITVIEHSLAVHILGMQTCSCNYRIVGTRVRYGF